MLLNWGWQMFAAVHFRFMSCRFFCSALLLVTVLGMAKRVDAVEAKAKANVVFIVADDLGLSLIHI